MWIEEMLEALERIRRYTAGLSQQGFAADPKTIDAVVRNLEIIGEAARRVPAEVQARHESVPWAEMRGLRNKVLHEYFSIDVGVIWQTVCEDLPPLADVLRAMLQEPSD